MPKLRAAFYRLLELGPDFTDRSHVYLNEAREAAIPSRKEPEAGLEPTA